ncbi:MAG: hypothetical protein C5B50_26005 [Verrucomicrobia bacterium]|nr:MAG: hypothetical protein C5B50_26005 [Verrucomicrobiota bacterium]
MTHQIADLVKDKVKDEVYEKRDMPRDWRLARNNPALPHAWAGPAPGLRKAGEGQSRRVRELSNGLERKANVI